MCSPSIDALGHHRLPTWSGLLSVLLIAWTVPPLVAQEPQATFRDVSQELGLELPNAAACWVDINNDGWVDLCAGGQLWVNQQGQKFVLDSEGWGAAVAADFDNDGWMDLFSWSNRKLYRNEQGKAFAEFPLPELPESVSRGACWGDFNGDGWADLYVGGYEDWDRGITWPWLLLINEQGNGWQLQRSESMNRTRGVTAADFDEDGDLDIYVSNYRLQPNQLWINGGNADFTDGAKTHAALATSEGFNGGHSIGAAWGDFDNDGHLDLFAGNFAHVDSRGDQPKSRFLRNLGPATEFQFKDLGTCGVPYQESYATPAVGDFDNDGRLDLFFTTVYGTASFGRPNHPILFRNVAPAEVADVTGEANLAELPPTYQAAWADFDNDGRLDLATAGKLFRNQAETGHWLKIRLRGDGQLIDRAALGGQVRIQIGQQTLTRRVEAGTGEGNQNDLTLHFGLGEHADPVTLEVTWPGRRVQRLEGVAVDQLKEIMFDAGSVTEAPAER